MKIRLLPRSTRLLGIAGAASLLAGCGLFQGPGDEYYRAEPLPKMKVPEGMQTTSLEPLYEVPELAAEEDELLLARDFGSFEAPRPDPLPTEGATDSGVKIQRLGDERWILIDAPTSQVWPRVQSFLSRYGVGVDVNDPGSGLIETDWVRFKVDAEQKHRYQIWIEQGLRPDTTEVHVVHRQVPEATPNDTALAWDRDSQDVERETYIVDELAASLASEARNGSASLLGQRVGGKAKADITFLEKEPVLQLRLDYDRAWATVTHALKQEGFVLWESDMDKATALFGYLVDRPEELSFIARWFADDLPDEAPATLEQVLGHLAPEPAARALFGDVEGAGFGEPQERAHTYLLKVEVVNGETLIYVRSSQGTRLSPRAARKILSAIRRNLI